jgi:hypothetical protein
VPALIKDILVGVYSDMDDVDFPRINSTVLKDLSHPLRDRDDSIVAVPILPPLPRISDWVIKPSPQKPQWNSSEFSC